MKYTPLLILLLSTLVLSTAADKKTGAITPFDPHETSADAVRQFWCDVDKAGRIIRVDAYGITIREFIQLSAIVAHEDVEIKECHDRIASLSSRDLSFVEIVHMNISSDGYEIAKGEQGRYIIRKKN